MIVDCHAHLVPQTLLDVMCKERARFPSVRLIEDGANLSFSFMGGKPTRPVAKGLSDIRDMEFSEETAVSWYCSRWEAIQPLGP